MSQRQLDVLLATRAARAAALSDSHGGVANFDRSQKLIGFGPLVIGRSTLQIKNTSVETMHIKKVDEDLNVNSQTQGKRKREPVNLFMAGPAEQSRSKKYNEMGNSEEKKKLKQKAAAVNILNKRNITDTIEDGYVSI